MNSIQKLYRGELISGEKRICDDSEYQKAIETVAEREKELRSSFSDGQWELFDSFCSAQSDLNVITAEEFFCSGFRAGVGLTVDGLFSRSENFD